MRSALLVACLIGLVGTVSAWGSSSHFGAYTGGELIPMEYLPTSGSSFAAFEKCTDDSDWPTAGGTFNNSLGLAGCKTQCDNAYTHVGQAMYIPSTKCCCQAITSAQFSAPSCINKVSGDIQSYLYLENLPGTCAPWYDICEHSSGGGWDQSCFEDVKTAPEYAQGDPDSAYSISVSWDFILDESGTSCATTGTDVTQITGTEGSCTEHSFTYDDNGSSQTITLYTAGYCDSVTNRGTVASFVTEAECNAWTSVGNYSFSHAAAIMFSGMESGTCEADTVASQPQSMMMTCSNWCSTTSGDGFCDSLHKAAKALGTMILIIIISVVVVSILGCIGCWYCCCRNKAEQTIVVQGGQAGVPMATPVTQAQPPGAVYMKNGVWLDKNDQPVAAQQV